MSDIRITVDDTDITGDDNMTILEAAKQNGIGIPTLCHHPELKPNGVCRV